MEIKLIKQFFEARKIISALILFFLFGLLIRIYNLGSHNLWYDEYLTYLCSNRLNVFALNCRSFFEYMPPLYSNLLFLWARFFGSSEFTLRSLAMIFGLLSILLIYKLGRLFFDARVGLSSAFILSISPMHIWYSQEVKGYSLSTFLTMLTVYFFVSALKKNSIYLWISFIVSSILAIYTNYFSIFIIILVGILFCFKTYRPLLKHYLASLCFILLAFLPFFPIFFKQAISIKNNFWIPKPHLSSIAITLENFNVGYNATPNIYFFTFMIFSLLFILGIRYWWQEKRKESISLISFLFIPIIFTFLISQKMPIYLDRQLIIFSPFYYIIIASGFTKIKRRIIKIALYLSISFLTFFCLNNYFSYRMPLPQYHHIGVHVKKPVKPAADYINSRFKEGDIIALPNVCIYNIFYYMPNISRKRLPLLFIDAELKKMKNLYKSIKETNRVQLEKRIESRSFYLEGESSIPGTRNIKELKFKRIWCVSSSWARDGNLDPNVKSVRIWMRNHYLLLENKESDGIFVELYGQVTN